MASDIDVQIGRIVEERRRRLGLTQRDLGQSLGLAFQSVHRIECGAAAMTLSRLVQLARALDVPLTYFIDQLKLDA